MLERISIHGIDLIVGEVSPPLISNLRHAVSPHRTDLLRMEVRDR